LTTFVVLPEPDCFTISVTIDDVVTNGVVALAVDLTGIDVHFEGEMVTLAVLVILTLISMSAFEGSILIFVYKRIFFLMNNNFITITTLLAATANSADADQNTEGYETENDTDNHTSSS